jgi:hypothetical protein
MRAPVVAARDLHHLFRFFLGNIMADLTLFAKNELPRVTGDYGISMGFEGDANPICL